MENLNWDEIQIQSDALLSCGLNKLKSQPSFKIINVNEESMGNYLISHNKIPYYIGEAKELKKRLKQQFNLKISTFYKNYKKITTSNQATELLTIDLFEIQFIPTCIGRKEIEEFGIINLPTKLNRFQLGKRDKCIIINQSEFWDAVQQNASKLLKEGESKILKLNYTPWFDMKIISLPGLYLVKDKLNQLIYIGESSNIAERIETHSGQTYFSALRRHIGTDILGFYLQEKNGKKRYFSEIEDKKVTEFLRTCKVAIFPVSFGRYELEEYLIKKHQPLLNRENNKNR
jgi:predicted GIY-YIG superfamily endonuclease